MTQQEHLEFLKMQEDLNTVKDTVNEIKVALLGDGYMSKGLVGELERMKGTTITELDKRISELEKFKNKVVYISIGLGMAGGLGIRTLIDWISNMSK